MDNILETFDSIVKERIEHFNTIHHSFEAIRLREAWRIVKSYIPINNLQDKKDDTTKG